MVDTREGSTLAHSFLTEVAFMSLCARRLFGAFLLVALTACPAMMPQAAPTAPPSSSSTSIQAASARRSAPRHRVRRRGRRAPPGGVVWARNAFVLDPSSGAVLYEK